jgi:anti-sigma regulatory factor (Ser/Thr protein kinase)
MPETKVPKKLRGVADIPRKHDTKKEDKPAVFAKLNFIMPVSRTDELALLHEAAGLLGRTLDPAVIYDTLQAMVARAMDCASLLVSIYAPEEGLIRCMYAFTDGQRRDPAAFPPLPLDDEGRGMQSQVIRSGQSLIIPDAVSAEKNQSARFYAHGDGTVTIEPDPNTPRVLSLVIVPIQLEGRVLGAAQVMSYRQAAYTPEHAVLLEALLIQVAAATRNAYLYQKVRAELTERLRVEAENVRLLNEAHDNVVRQRIFLRDVLASVTGGHLQLCDTPDELPPPLPQHSAVVTLSLANGLRELRHLAADTARSVGLSPERCFDLELAVGEAGMNAVVHAGSGIGQVFWDGDSQVVHVRIEDHGEGISVENLPQATLKRGYSTKATLGHGMKMILQTADRLWLLTGLTGTIVVLEQGPLPPEAEDATGWF